MLNGKTNLTSCFWKKAEVINVRTGNKTIITIDDVRVNLGLPAIDFMVGALDKFEY